MSWVLLVAAFYVSNVGDQDEPSMFDQPTNWGRVAVVCTLIISAVILHVFNGWTLHIKTRRRDR